jgi:hypothetical protein
MDTAMMRGLLLHVREQSSAGILASSRIRWRRPTSAEHLGIHSLIGIRLWDAVASEIADEWNKLLHSRAPTFGLPEIHQFLAQETTWKWRWRAHRQNGQSRSRAHYLFGPERCFFFSFHILHFLLGTSLISTSKKQRSPCYGEKP